MIAMTPEQQTSVERLLLPDEVHALRYAMNCEPNNKAAQVAQRLAAALVRVVGYYDRMYWLHHADKHELAGQ